MTDLQMLSYFEGMYDGDKDASPIRMYRKSVVRTRRKHFCPGLSAEDGHRLPPGIRAIRETFLFDGKWCAAYTCEAHVIEWAKVSGQLREQEERRDD